MYLFYFFLNSLSKYLKIPLYKKLYFVEILNLSFESCSFKSEEDKAILFLQYNNNCNIHSLS